MNQEFMTSLLEKNLRFIYDAEHQILEGLHFMSEQAFSVNLRKAFQRHEKETRHQIKRLDDAAHNLLIDLKKDQSTTVKKALSKGKEIMRDIAHIGSTPAKRPIIQSIIEDSKELTESLQNADSEIVDFSLASSGILIEEAEIASYQTLCYLAQKLEEPESLGLLQQNLEEEKQMLFFLKDFSEQELKRKLRTSSQRRPIPVP
jgi:ferritin-like metal-binding protein YciE